MFYETRWDGLHLLLCTFTFFLLQKWPPKLPEGGTPLQMPSELKHIHAGMEGWPIYAVRKQDLKCVQQFPFSSHWPAKQKAISPDCPDKLCEFPPTHFGGPRVTLMAQKSTAPETLQPLLRLPRDLDAQRVYIDLGQKILPNSGSFYPNTFLVLCTHANLIF